MNCCIKKKEWRYERPSLMNNKNISDIFEIMASCRHCKAGTQKPFSLKFSQKEHITMSQFITAFFAGIVAAVIVSNTAFVPTPAAAAPMSDADKAAMKRATATCRAQVKEQARFNEMSLFARHKLVKKCVDETLKH
jgi:short-subunit dehydrogenase involved in D-alanine esterification of teichoic acids